jgi:hypothetical protein
MIKHYKYLSHSIECIIWLNSRKESLVYVTIWLSLDRSKNSSENIQRNQIYQHSNEQE